jgi:hypothetical protein
MRFIKHHPRRSLAACAAFTVQEVVVSIAIMALVFEGIIYGYTTVTYRGEWSAYNLAAQSFAAQGMEQARAAKWDPQSWDPATQAIIDDLPPTNFSEADTLDTPISGVPVLATNYISIVNISTNPAIRQIRSDCVWMFLSRGPFTNTVITYRAPDQ